MKLDLGCGQNKKEGFIGIDAIAKCNPDVVWDLRKTPWEIDGVPIADQSVEEVFSSHFLEHLSGWERMPFMNELWRVMKVDAKATFVFPYGLHKRAVQDPTHAWPTLVEESFMYFNRGWRELNKLDHYPLTCDFDFTYGYALDEGEPLLLGSRAQQFQMMAVKHYVNSVADLQIVMTRRADVLSE